MPTINYDWRIHYEEDELEKVPHPDRLCRAGAGPAGWMRCAAAEQVSSENGAVGTVLLSVNPEIEVEYDKNGLVLEIEGLNEDGKTVVKDVKDYQGKDCRTVVSELVRDIYADGYFEGTVDGHVKNIVLKLEEGSVYVSDEFLQDVVDGIREAVQEWRHRREGHDRQRGRSGRCRTYRSEQSKGTGAGAAGPGERLLPRP